jgi:STE24 endopeptidase
MMVLLALCLVAVAAAGHWFSLPLPRGIPNWHQDFTSQEFARAQRYRAQTAIWGWWTVLSPLLTAVLFMAVRPVRRTCVRAVERVPILRAPGHSALLTAGLLLLTYLSTLPASYMLLTIQRRYKLSTQSNMAFAQSVALQALLQTVFVFAGVLVVLRYMRRRPNTWATRLALTATLFIALIALLPVFRGILPERTSALPNAAQAAQLQALAARAGVPALPIRVSLARGTDDQVNAYASGSGPWARVVLQRASLKKTTPAELESIVAHEIGHIRAHDPLTTGLAAACLCGIFIAGLGLLARRLPRTRSGDVVLPRMVPALVLAWCVIQLAGQPFVNQISRGVETRADLASLELTRDPATFIAMMRRVGVVNLAYLGNGSPNAWLHSHPTVVQRIANARAWAQDHRLSAPSALPTSGRTQ